MVGFPHYNRLLINGIGLCLDLTNYFMLWLLSECHYMQYRSLAGNVPQVVAVALHGSQPAVMGWPTPRETPVKCGKVKIVQLLFGGSAPVTLYLVGQSK